MTHLTNSHYYTHSVIAKTNTITYLSDWFFLLAHLLFVNFLKFISMSNNVFYLFEDHIVYFYSINYIFTLCPLLLYLFNETRRVSLRDSINDRNTLLSAHIIPICDQQNVCDCGSSCGPPRFWPLSADRRFSWWYSQCRWLHHCFLRMFFSYLLHSK